MPKFDELQRSVQVDDVQYGETYTFDGTWGTYSMYDNSRSWMPPPAYRGAYPHVTINGDRWDNKSRLTRFHVTLPFGGREAICAHYYFDVDFHGGITLNGQPDVSRAAGYEGQAADAIRAMTYFAQAFITAAFQRAAAAAAADSEGYAAVGKKRR